MPQTPFNASLCPFRSIRCENHTNVTSLASSASDCNQNAKSRCSEPKVLRLANDNLIHKAWRAGFASRSYFRKQARCNKYQTAVSHKAIHVLRGTCRKHREFLTAAVKPREKTMQMRPFRRVQRMPVTPRSKTHALDVRARATSNPYPLAPAFRRAFQVPAYRVHEDDHGALQPARRFQQVRKAGAAVHSSRFVSA